MPHDIASVRNEIAPRWAGHLVDALMEHVAALLPTGGTALVDDDGWPRVRLTADRPGWALFDFRLLAAIRPDDDVHEQLSSVVTTFLDFVQDFAVLHTRTPWPGTGTTLPLPHVAVVADRLEVGYGNAVRLSVALPPNE